MINKKSSENPQGYIEILLKTAREYPDFIALEFPENGRTWTYPQMSGEIAKAGGKLQRIGIKAGDRVCLLLPTCPEYIFIFYALSALGATTVSASPQASPFELEIMLESTGVSTLITSEKIYSNIREEFSKEEFNKIEKTLRILLVDAPGRSAGIDFETSDACPVYFFEEVEFGSITLTPPDPQTIVTIHFTYKGVGIPLGVEHSYRDYALYIDYGQKTAPTKRGNTFLSMLPFYSVFGFAISIILAMSLKQKIVLIAKLPLDLLSIIRKKQVNIICVVPEHLYFFLKLASRYKGRVSDLNARFLCAGNTLKPSFTRKFEKIFKTVIIEGFGTTETLPATLNCLDNYKAGSLGLPMSSMIEIEIRDLSGENVKIGFSGEVWVKSPVLSPGFLNQPEISRRFFKDGWFYTGDLGHKDDSGHLFFDGRQQPFTKVNSQMVDLTEVRNLINTHPLVKKSAIRVRNGTVSPHILEAEIKPVFRPGVHKAETIKAWMIHDYLSRHLSSHKIPEQIRIIEECRQD